MKELKPGDYVKVKVISPMQPPGVFSYKIARVEAVKERGVIVVSFKDDKPRYLLPEQYDV